MWEQVLGHERQKQFLARYLKAQERPHALLFLGAAGLGKRRLALEFARALLCAAHTGTDGCEACRLMHIEDGNLSHPDFLLVQREQDPDTGRYKDISIDQIKELISKSAFAPVMSATKVCLIEDVDRMTVPAANSFLKLLEEPPAGWVLLLVAETEEKLLPTILSRVVRLRFGPLAPQLVEQALLERGLAKQEAAVLARLSEGSLGQALALQEQKALELRQQALAFIEALPLATPLNYLADRVWQKKDFARPEALLLVRLWQQLLHDLLMCRLQLAEQVYNIDVTTELVNYSSAWSLQGLKQALALTQEAYTALENNTGVRMVLEAWALQIDQVYKNGKHRQLR